MEAIAPFESPFTHLLSTNYTPDSQESTQIAAFLRKPQEDLDSLNDEIKQLQASLNNLIAQRDAVRFYIDRHRALLSPFRRLPADILRQIFIQCLPTDQYPVRSTSTAPLLVTRVCRFWRAIALSTPQLWCAIHIYIPQLMSEVDLEAHVSLIDKRREGVEHWLKRSGTLPLCISFAVDARPFFYLNSSHHAHHNLIRARRMQANMALIAILLQFFDRLKAVSFRGPLSLFAAVSSKVVECANGIASRLEYAELDFVSDNAFGEEPQIGPSHVLNAGATWCRTPAIRRIRVYNDMQSPLLLQVPWHNVTEVVFHPLSGIPPMQALKILSKTCQKLEKCSMSVRVPWGTTDREDMLVELPYLRILRLAFSRHWHQDPDMNFLNHTDLRDLFQRIHAPSIRELSVVARFALDIPEVPFLSFLSQTSHGLKTLRLNLPLAEQTLIRCLRLCPSLSVLSITEHQPPTEHPWDTRDTFPPTISTAVMRALMPTGSGDHSPLCPQLENIVFRNCATRNVQGILSLISTRWRQADGRNITRLKAFSISFKHDIGSDYDSELEALREEGLKIQWVHEKRHQAMDSPNQGMMYHDDPRDNDSVYVEALDTDWT
ncbi:hypothetical protein Moror_1922 [Moniliophthora roreri MCA 2997]|uniref:Uncharacterized protein n=2 Tax=Moniliophthora roreri TaxID=221103 RepID=V2X1H5_MONRO|nr:hypothetical protein Moror_1922 [Moniliophthora roreri MCA 2997]KAI3595076.1 hypothetical protein WG66_001142 [Moniliophthora roreri]